MTVTGLHSEVPVGARDGLDHEGEIAIDNVITIPTSVLGRTIGFLSLDQERHLARAIVLAHDLDIALLG